MMKYIVISIFAIMLVACSKSSPGIDIVTPVSVDTLPRLFVSIMNDSAATAVVADSLVEKTDASGWNLQVKSNKTYPVRLTGAIFRTASFLMTKLRVGSALVSIASGFPEVVFSDLAIVIPPGNDGAIVPVRFSVGPLPVSRTRKWDVLYVNLESLSYQSGSIRYQTGNTVRLQLTPVTVYAPQ